MDLKQCLEQIAFLPDGTSIFLPESQAEKNLLVSTKLHHKGLSLWLKNLVGGEALHPDAVEKFWMSQPFAEIWKARFDLIVGVHSRCPDFQEMGFENPSELWLWCISEQANRDRESIFDSSIQQKSEYLNKGFALFKELKDLGIEYTSIAHPVADPTGNDLAVDVLTKPFLAVMLQAQFLNETLPEFWDDYYHPWIKAENRALRKISRNRKIQFLNLIDDKIHVTKKGQNLKLLQNVKPPMRFGAQKNRR